MNRKRLLIAVLFVCFGLAVSGQEDASSAPRALAPNEVYLRFDALSGGGPKWLRAKAVSEATMSGASVKVGREYVRVDKQIFADMERKSSAAYWYNVLQEEDSLHFLVHARTSKNAIGIGSSFLFYPGIAPHRNWLQDEYQNNFEGAVFKLRDISVGLLYARQLFGVNRHRIVFETEPGYRQIHQTFSADRYTTSYPAVDPAGNPYDRFITVSNYNETRERHCVDIPLDVRYDIFVIKQLSLFLAGGIDNVFVVSDRGQATFDASYAGRYGEDMFNVLIDDNGYYDFGHYPNISLTQQGKFGYGLYGMGKFGAQYFVGTVFSVELACVYMRYLCGNLPDGKGGDFCLSESADTYQSMAVTMKPTTQHRIGINLNLKVNF